MATHCPGCGQSVDPIRIFDRSPKTGKPYLIVQCPRERCKFNIDIEPYTGKPAPKVDEKPDDTGRSFWRYGM